MIEVADGNDEALAAGIALAAMMPSFVCTQEIWHVGTNMANEYVSRGSVSNKTAAATHRAATHTIDRFRRGH